MSEYNIVCSDEKSTVVAEYTPSPKRDDFYQSEAQLEQDFIKRLQGQGYEYISVTDESGMVINLRRLLETLNGYTFTDSEWLRFFADSIANKNEGIVEKTRKIQDDYVQILKRDDGTTKNIILIDKKNIHNNRLQVLNQYETAGGTHSNRYDVTVLVNGLPLVHIELKRRGVAIREAINQINRYQRESFWALSGLFEYVQLFVISNGTYTKYYSNTTRFQHIKETGGDACKSKKKTSNSFEFTSYWADGKNKVIADLMDFTKTFFAKHTILNIFTRYCVFTAEELLLVMRPYQIAATERILNRIEVANNYKKYGGIEGGGYIWHTTGSGKTTISRMIRNGQGLSFNKNAPPDEFATVVFNRDFIDDELKFDIMPGVVMLSKEASEKQKEIEEKGRGAKKTSSRGKSLLLMTSFLVWTAMFFLSSALSYVNW